MRLIQVLTSFIKVSACFALAASLSPINTYAQTRRRPTRRGAAQVTKPDPEEDVIKPDPERPEDQGKPVHAPSERRLTQWMKEKMSMLPKAKGDGMYVDVQGNMKGEVTVVGITECFEPVVLQDAVREAFKAGVKYVDTYWNEKATKVHACGGKMKINPALTYKFAEEDDNLDALAAKSNLLYVQDKANALGTYPDPTNEKKISAVLGFNYRPSGNLLWWKNEVETRRGKGVLPAFNIAIYGPHTAAPERWGRDMAHELGHAMGLWDADDAAEGGLMSHSTGTVVNPAYVAEVMTRLYQCRIDVTMTLDKTSVAPQMLTHDWDFLGSMTFKWSNVLTSQWAYFNGGEGGLNMNPCDIFNTDPKLRGKYLMCDGTNELNTTRQIDFMLYDNNDSENTPVPGGLHWERENPKPKLTSTPAFRVGKGDCAPPVTSDHTLNDVNLELACDGKQAWLVNAWVNKLLLTVKATPPASGRPQCTTADVGVSWVGQKIPASGKSDLARLSGESVLIQGTGPEGKAVKEGVGKFLVEVEMSLVKIE